MSTITRRNFCISAAALVVHPPAWLAAETAHATPTRPDVASIDHDRILSAALKYVAQPPKPLTTLPCPRSPGTLHDFYSEAGPDPDAAKPSTTPAFTAHADALFELGLAVPALAAAYSLTSQQHFADHAALQLRAWLVDPATKMSPSMDFAQVVPGATGAKAHQGRPEGILETLPLVEIALAIPFLAPVLPDTDMKAIQAWFAAYLQWLTAPQDSVPRLAAQARDRKDHHGSSWLLQVAAYTRLTAPADSSKAEDHLSAELRHRFKAATLRAQINADGTFPHELTSSAPYRNSLFNLDLLAGVCELLTTRFEDIWSYQLDDGAGMRAAIAYHYPLMLNRGAWPYRADNAHFDQLPGRRASLLFAAKAYSRPEYSALWKSLPPDPAEPDILRTTPIHQPLLWVRTPPRAG